MTRWFYVTWVSVMKYFSNVVIPQVSSSEKPEVKYHSNQKYRLMSANNGAQHELKGEGLQPIQDKLAGYELYLVYSLDPFYNRTTLTLRW